MGKVLNTKVNDIPYAVIFAVPVLIIHLVWVERAFTQVPDLASGVLA